MIESVVVEVAFSHCLIAVGQTFVERSSRCLVDRSVVYPDDVVSPLVGFVAGRIASNRENRRRLLTLRSPPAPAPFSPPRPLC